MGEQEFTDIELEKRLQEHYARHHGEVRPTGDLWNKVEPNLRSPNGIAPHIETRATRKAEQPDWLPLPAGYRPRKAVSWLPRAVTIVTAIAAGLLLVWLFSSVRVVAPPVAATPAAFTPTTTLANQPITTVRAIDWATTGNTWAYVTGIDDQPTWPEPAAYIKSSTPQAQGPQAQGVGALQRYLSIEKYRGQRLRLTAFVMAESVEGYAGLWLHINDTNGMLLTDEMRDRPITGSTDWQQYEVVMDVPQDGLIATFGVQMEGRGGVWIKDARLALVDKSVATTGAPPPYNLGFEAGLSNWNYSPGEGYTIGIDKNVAHSGQASAFVEAGDSTSGVGIIVQHFLAGDFGGKRLRISGYLRSQDVSDWGGLYASVYESLAVTRRTLAFDDTENRPISGTSDWQRFEMILDVPEQATGISMGALNASHRGRLWLDDFAIEEVDKNVSITGYTTLREARNLGFEAGLEDWYALAGRISVDKATTHNGQASARLEAIKAPSGTHAFLAQNVVTDPYKNRRVRISAYVRTEGAEAKATLQASVAEVLLSEVFASEPLTGTNDWTRLEVTARVPEEPGRLQIDLLLEGDGTAWIDDVQIEVIE